MVRGSHRRCAALLAALGLGSFLALATPTNAVAAPPPGPSQPAIDPVGGELLGSTDVVAPAGGPPLPPVLSASAWLVADLDSGAVLAARDPHGRYAPASTLKTLTALTLIPRLGRNDVVGASFDDINVEGSKVGLVEGVGYPISELFTALMVVSGNDAANALATAAGGREQTVRLMNDEARRLQARDTVARNPSGLDAADQWTSAYDLALIARAGMKLPDFAEYVAVRASSISAPGGARFQIYTHDKLLTHYPDALGIKNGYTVQARGSFVGAAQRNGHTLVVSLLHADPTVWKEAAALLDWGFAAEESVAPVGRLVGPVGEDSGAPDAPTSREAAGADRRTASGTRVTDGRGVQAAAPGRSSGLVTRPLVSIGMVAALCVGGLRVRARRRYRRRPPPRPGRRQDPLVLPRNARRP